MTDPNETLPLVQAYKEIDQLKAELDGIKSRQETDLTEQKRVVAGLIQIASSLPSDEDVFHPKSVETAKDALALIDQLYLSNMGYGYAIEVLRRNMGLDNTSHDFSECLETFNNLKAELAKAQELLREVMTWHSDAHSSDYNGCDQDKCNWCERASRVGATEGKV